MRCRDEVTFLDPFDWWRGDGRWGWNPGPLQSVRRFTVWPVWAQTHTALMKFTVTQSVRGVRVGAGREGTQGMAYVSV